MVFLAPAVKTRELDFSSYVGQASTSVVGVVGGGSRGPIGTPTLLTNPNDLPRIFGEPTIADHGPMAAIQFLQKGNQLWYIREADEDLVAKANAKFSGKDESDAAVADILTIEFNEYGTYGNKFSASITEVNGLDFTMTIFNGKVVHKSVKASLDSDSPKFIENANDSEFTFIVELGEATKIDEVTKVAFTGGHDGLPIPSNKIIGIGNRGLQAFANPNLLDINILAVPGRYEASIVTEMLKICENRFDCFALIDPPQGLTPTEVVQYHNGELTGQDMPKGGLDSSYGAIYYPWVKVANPYTGVDEWIPPSGVVAGAFAYNDSVAEAWFATAGLNRGKLTTVLELEYDMSDGEMDLLYGNDNAVNPIINYKKNGFVIWGNRTLQRQDSATDRVNVRRLMLQVRKAVAASTAYMLFEQNDQFTWEQWKGMIDPYLETIKSARGLYDYLVVMDESTVTPAHIDRNEMPGQVLLKPTKSAEFIPIDFVLKSTGASFGN
ncbi:tail sheath protein [Bacillus phage SP-15]|uniref:Tail sheath protein n=1 Tax=Bacillus phage SP-15 TaxID=1792032 RepID=A0A127AW39_9CAUD|nr:tail sheath [Bacillus phage SP-15]AMM44842.1 tail sheath protein [Bacillus phage SP-15]